MTTFSERLKKCRKDQGLTQKQAAEIFSIQPRLWQMYEAADVKNSRHPSPKVLHQIADYFAVSLDYLEGRTDDPAATAESPMPAGIVSVPIYNFSAVVKSGLDAPVSGKLPVLAELLPDAAGAFALRQDASFGLDAQGFKDVPVVVMCPVSSIDEDDKIYLVKHGDVLSLRRGLLAAGGVTFENDEGKESAAGFAVIARVRWFVQTR